MMLINCVLILILFTIASKPTKSFLEKFETVDKSRWIFRDGQMICVGNGHCQYMQRSNIKHQFADHAKDPHRHYLQFTLRNDCKDINMCCGKSGCSPFTGAEVMTTEKFGYGSFRVYAIAVHGVRGLVKNRLHNVWNCFYVDNRKGLEKPSMSISICAFAGPGATDDVALTWKFGKEENGINVPLGFNVQGKYAMYRFDWTATSIKWFVNGKNIHEISSEKYRIPSESMQFKMGIYPTIDYDQEIPHDHFTNHFTNSNNIVVRMNVYRVRYIEEAMMNAMHSKGEIHDELFVIGESDSIHYGLIAVVVGIVILAIGFLWSIIRLLNRTNASSNHAYILLDGNS